MDEGVERCEFVKKGAERGPMDEDIHSSILPVDCGVEFVGVWGNYEVHEIQFFPGENRLGE